jgi:hypothetical protein
MTTKINPSEFASPFDVMHTQTQYAKEQYKKGQKLVHEISEMHIATNGCWSGRTLDGGSLQAYERLAYHACVNELLRGYLEAGGKVIFHGFRNITGEVGL